jgi:crotonobetainyl-CoA:carnitine CoA-transferase CaiB-like acyl-CoA transferase
MAAQAGDSEPVLFTIPINDVCAAATSAFAICLGLYHRARTGQGQRAVTSLVASSLSMQSGELVRYADRPPSVRGGADFAGPSPADRFYRTADGWLRVQARSVASLRAALGLPLSPAADARPRGAGSAPTASANGADDAAAIGAAMAGLARAACIQRLAEAGIPAVPAHHPADLRGKPEIEELCLLAEHRLQNGTSLFMPHRYARFSRTEQDAIRDTPGVGEHSREVLVEAGLTDPELDQLIEQRAVIQGAPLVLRGLINYR